MITVFTPAYNRAHLLPRLFESLCKQTNKDFEWLIVDDGSVDDTKSLTLSLSNREGTWFPVRYFWQENGGKHRAINRGVKEAKGELFFIVDSDDYLVDNSLEIISRTYETIKFNKTFGGVAGLLKHSDGTIIGTMPNSTPTDCTQVDYWCKYHIHGDKTEIFRTDVLREIPFPEYEGEKFCPEELEWLRIAKKYKLRYVNEVLAVRDYLDGGLTSKIVKIRMQSPRAAIADYSLFNEFDIPVMRKVRNAINYWRFRFCLQSSYMKYYKIPKLDWYWNCMMPLGFLMHRMDLRLYCHE